MSLINVIITTIISNIFGLYSYMFPTTIFQYMVIRLYQKSQLYIYIFIILCWIIIIKSHILCRDNELCDEKNEPLCGKNLFIFCEKHIAWNIRLKVP